ncbi:MAG: tetratricopeptide repeat protein [Acidobacteria bacterium]|nr:tetratricopeptide repeat protein [Acidobacteriota bacterium]
MCSELHDATRHPSLCRVNWRGRIGGSLSLLLLLGLIAIAVCLLAPERAVCQGSEDQIARYFHLGQEALRQGQFSRAAEEFRKVLALDPGLLEAEVNLGLAYHSLAEYELAVRHLTKALGQRPDLLAPSVIVGMDYLKLGSPAKAIPFLERALRLDPSNREARQALASSYLGQENFRQAAKEFRELAAVDSDKSEAWFRLGHEYLDLSARLAYRGAHLYRESAWGHRFLGDLLFQRSRWDEAAQEYQKALTADSQQPGLHTSLGQAHLHSGHVDKAAAEFRRELELDQTNELAWLGLAESALTEGEGQTALERLTKVWQISPEFLAIDRDFPTVELPPDTLKALIETTQTSEGPAAHFLLAGLYAASNARAQSDSWTKAFRLDFAAWQKQDPVSSGQDPCRAHRYSRCADSLLRQAHLTNSRRLVLGKTEFVLRDYESAADALAEVNGVNRENAEASYWLALTYRSLGAECYARLEDSFPDSWRTHQLRAEGYALRQDIDNAVKEFHLALELRPNDAELHEALGEAYLNRHSDEDAQRELTQSLEIDATRTRALYLLGRLYVQRRENEKALPYLRQALRLQPDLVEASSLLGTTYVRLGQFTNAIPQLEKAAPSDHYGNVHYQLYLAYRKLGQAQLAQKALARSQDLRRSSLEHDQALIMGGSQAGSETE